MIAASSGEGLCINGTLGGTCEAVRTALVDVRGHLEASGDFASLDSTWELVLAEVLNNIVEHAYRDIPRGEIQLTLIFSPGTLHAEFLDFGRPMPGKILPKGRAVDLDVPLDAMPEGGFGWYLIHNLATRLEYHHENGANRLVLDLPLTSPD